MMNFLTDSPYKKYIYILFFICFSVLVYRAFNVSVYDSGRARNQIYGDGYSDINTISSAKYFLDSGFTQTVLLPVHDYYPNLIQNKAYTHYPALPNILAGVYAVIFNSVNEPILRIIPLLLAIVFFFLIFKVLYQITQNHQQTFIGGASILLACYYICWADNLHQHLYGEMLKWIYVSLLFAYYFKPQRNKLYFIPMWVIMLLQVNISFEQPVYLGVLTLAFSVLFDRKIFSYETITAGLFVGIGFGLHIYQNAIYFGGWDLAIKDLKDAFLFRSAGVETAGQIAEDAFGLSSYWQIPFTWFNRMERFFMFPGWAFVIIAYWVFSELKAKNKKMYKVLWALFFASVAWSFFMAQHAYIHTFTNKHFAVFYALIMGMGLPLFYQKMKWAYLQKQKVGLVFYSLLATYMIAMFITQQVIPVFIQFGICYKLV